MTVGSLFAGIGGFDLAAERVGWQVKWQVEIDDYATKVLEKHWPHVRRYRDIRAIDWADVEPVDVVCGGFPCQPHSVAGSKLAAADERDMWSEYVRCLRALRRKPRWVVGENVGGLLASDAGRFFGGVLRDLADIGFDAEWSSVSACAVGAPHVRQRVFIVAHADGLDGRAGVWHRLTRAFRPLQAIDGFEDSRAGWQARLADPSALYGGANGVSDGPHRNHAIGNAIVPQVAEWIFRQIQAAEDGAL